jgi:branched-chain amino acid aminotransferase
MDKVAAINLQGIKSEKDKDDVVSISGTHVTKASSNTPPPPRPGIKFESLPWNLNHPESHSYVHLTTNSCWNDSHYDPKDDSGDIYGCIVPYSSTPLNIYPSTTSLNYGTTVWEGLKCFRLPTTDESPHGEVAIFRPLKNFERFRNGCERMCLPAPSLELFCRALQLAVQVNGDLIPPVGHGMKLYLRPIMLGSGQQLGLHPSSEFSYITFVSPTGSYFQGKTAASGLKVHLETRYSRAARGGMGATKCCGNYGATLLPLTRAKEAGYHDNLYLELDTYSPGDIHSAIIQEMSAANIFLVLRTGEITTPCLTRGTILPGVTRDSVLVLARDFVEELRPFVIQSTGDETVKVTITERDVTVGDLTNASEVFVTGTAAEIVPVMSISTNIDKLGEEDFHANFQHGATLPGGPVTEALLRMLREVMAGERKVKTDTGDGWLPNPYASADEFRSQVLGCTCVKEEE